jgi:hypothetical protein
MLLESNSKLPFQLSARRAESKDPAAFTSDDCRRTKPSLSVAATPPSLGWRHNFDAYRLQKCDLGPSTRLSRLCLEKAGLPFASLRMTELFASRHFPPRNVQKMKGAAPKGGAADRPKRAGLPLKRGVPGERSKKIKKIVDDLTAILNLATYECRCQPLLRCAVMAAGLTNRQSRLLSWRKRLAESLNQGD